MHMNIKRLKEIRERKGLFQKDIAKLLNTTQQVYSEYELGVRLIPLDKIDKLSNFYDLSVYYLINRTDEKKPYPNKKEQ